MRCKGNEWEVLRLKGISQERVIQKRMKKKKSECIVSGKTELVTLDERGNGGGQGRGEWKGRGSGKEMWGQREEREGEGTLE